MTGKTHALCGTATMLAITVLGSPSLTLFDQSFIPAVGLITVAAGSYAPDIDIQQSKLGHTFRFISKHLKHRGFTHTLAVPVFLAFLMYWTSTLGIPLLPELVGGFEVGYLCHIIADMCNKKGVPLLWPLSSSHIHVASVLTGSWQEKVFLLVWIGGNIAWVLTQFA